MDDEEKIFGPFNLRQFLYLAFGGGLAYLSFNYLEPKIGIPASIFIGGVTFALLFINNVPSVPIDENYFKIKRSHFKNSEEFERWLRKKMALIQYQVQMRKLKGLNEDPKLNEVLKMIEKELSNKR